MRMPKSYWPEYVALGLFMAGPITMMVVSFIIMLR